MRTLTIIAGLAAVLLVSAAFVNKRNERAMKNLKTAGNDNGFAVVELFTSEGCSSCPPADRFFETLQRDNANKQLFLLAFHVDYWDHQGWKDRFSDAAYSNRQAQYAQWMNLRTIYTPQVVVNGASEHVGSNTGAILQAITAGLEEQASGTLTLHAQQEGNKLAVTYQQSGNAADAELVLALVQRATQSNVKAGENAGRKLTHVQVVRRMVHFPLSAAKKNSHIQLPDDFSDNGWELIGFVQDNASGHITAAARTGFQSAD
ncbi:thioredoxin family protein [uncultured Chitinophaga sp.]|jgi:Uncharacterized secreted protein|uniref:DUF1223 domain-containing protein n=1 Tax=uncultured Chitinophaga sp. TaxID=339340 RepID=UPI002606C384|nr:DUF1223 domain-containing protein [uncultured Chitinophaga sp.]